MKNKTKRALSFIASACLLATSLTAFGANADEEDVVVTEASVVTTQAKSTETEVKSTTKATEAESKATTKDDSDDAVAVTTKVLEVAKGDDETDTTTVTTGADGAVTTTEEGTTLVTTIAPTTDSDDEATTTGAGFTVTTTGATTSAKGTVTDDDTNVTHTTTYATTIDGTKVTTTYSTTEAVEETVKYTHTNDVVLTIDTSDSVMEQAYAPAELVKKTAIDLVNKILDEDPTAQISLVEFFDEAYNYTWFDEDGNETSYTNDRETLIETINLIYDNYYDLNGSTNYINALNKVKLVLDDGTGENKSVVIMTDGVPGTTVYDSENNDTFYDVPINYVYGEDYDRDYKDTVIEYANEVIKPMATIYTIGYFQHLNSGEEAGEARAFLQDLASDGVEGAKYYEANDKNIDEITDLITQDIIYNAPPEGKTAEDNTADTTTSADKDADSPKTGDAGVASVIVLGGLACALVVTTKRKND